LQIESDNVEHSLREDVASYQGHHFSCISDTAMPQPSNDQHHGAAAKAVTTPRDHIRRSRACAGSAHLP